jgi:hypothetical protein
VLAASGIVVHREEIRVVDLGKLRRHATAAWHLFVHGVVPWPFVDVDATGFHFLKEIRLGEVRTAE